MWDAKGSGWKWLCGGEGLVMVVCPQNIPSSLSPNWSNWWPLREPGERGSFRFALEILVVCMRSLRVCYTCSVFFKSAAQPSSLQGHTKGFPGTRSVVSDHLLGNRLCQGQDLLSGTLAGWGVIAEDWGQRWKVTTVEPGKIIIFLNNWWGMTKLEAWRQWWICDTSGKA